MGRRPNSTALSAFFPALLLLAGLALGPSARAEDGPPPAPPKAPAAEKAPAKPADPLVIGVFPVSVEQVIDGDTLRLADGKPSVRILGLDSEEKFRDERDRVAATQDFAAYAKAKRGDSPRPVKYGTPAGEAARVFVQELVKGCTKMRLERDHAGARERGTFGRILAHVFLLKEGGEVNVAEEVIRQGHSPVFVKYGRSTRFHTRFHAAQTEAREKGRGIWSQGGPAHYPDYAERLAWWKLRDAQVLRWKEHAAKPGHVTLGSGQADKKLAALVDKEAVVFGLFDRELKVRSGDKRIFLLGHQPRRGFPLVVFDLELAKSLFTPAFESMYVTVRGKVTLYKDRPQMVIERADQVSTK